MDLLKNALLQQMMQGGGNVTSQEPNLPSPPFSPPPTPKPHLPSRMQRWLTAQRMIAGYQNGGTPNPTITRITDKP